MTQQKWKSVVIATADYNEILEMVVPVLGYSSVSSFVQEAVREKLDSERWRVEKRLKQIAHKQKAFEEEHIG